ncbi:MAG: HAMP domain-containing histidine kinase, partial [Gemmatimonadetes bacterium]|nr:HAMP domain-containing histidine kinase [Gemmatimonadota bacterium]
MRRSWGVIEPGRRPSLRREVLLGLSLLAAAALSVAVISALLAAPADPGYAVAGLVVLIIADVAVVVLFGRYLVERFVLRPMTALTGAVAEIASGDLQRRAPEAETSDFTELAAKFNQMTELLLDAQSQLVRAEKLASIGRLAAGVAHEVGNPLAAIGSYVEVLRQRGTEPEVLAAMARECQRIDRIVRGLLEYARPKEEQAVAVEVSGVVRGAVDLLQRQGALKGVALRFEIEDRALPVPARFHDLEQVMVNLLLNARDAAPDGTITVGVQSWVFDPSSVPRTRRTDSEVRAGVPARPHPRPHPLPQSRRPFRTDLEPGAAGVLLYVADSGPGVPPDDRERIFDPFFTTKEPGAGTGLGLAIVQRIVHELGGLVWVDEAREGGAAFKIFLPNKPPRAKSADRRVGGSPGPVSSHPP